MNQSNAPHQNNVLLYRIVYESPLVALFSFVLFLSIMLPPLEQAYASEPVSPEVAAPISIPVAEDAPVDFPDPVVVEPLETETEETSVEATETASEEVVTTATQASDANEVTEPVDLPSGVTEISNETEVATSTGGETEASEVVPEESSSTTPPSEDTSPSEAEVGESESESSEESATNDTAEIPVEITSTTSPATIQEAQHFNDSNRFQFSTEECVSVGDGAFYCSQPESEMSEATDAVYAAPDEDGDMEIFVRVAGEEVKITSNIVDDAAPYYAAEENRVVWHSLINDRYQIMSYDIDTNNTSQLTDSPFNNMEPVMVGDTILWQAWIQNNWEIVIYDGVSIEQLTNNEIHDVAPSIKDNYIMWQTQFPEGWKVAIYNRDTKTADYVDVDSVSGALENPRLVLLLDHVDENGNRQMIGYDMETKQPVAFAAIPAPLPDELPEPDQTGEERALVQVKPSLKEGEESSFDTTEGGNGASFNPNPDLSTAAGTTPTIATSTDLVVPPYVTPAQADTLAPPVVATATAAMVLPTDVVIPPFSSTTETTIE